MTGTRVDIDTYQDVVEFLVHEAELLDHRRLDEWLGLLADDIEYVVPVRQSVSAADGEGFAPDAAWLRENRRSLDARVRRLQATFPWSDDPPSRSRHFVSNIRATSSENDREISVSSSLLLYRSRGDGPEHEFLVAERRDLLRRADGAWRLARREVYLDHAAVGARDFSVLL